MSKFFLIFSMFAVIVSMTVCASHAHASLSTLSEIPVSVVTIDVDSQENSTSSGNDCGITCGGCCVHHLINTFDKPSNTGPMGKSKMLMPDTNISVSDIIYNLKRPPRS